MLETVAICISPIHTGKKVGCDAAAHGYAPDEAERPASPPPEGTILPEDGTMPDRKESPTMSEQAGSTDPDKILAKGLEHFRKVAETEKGHSMDHWRFQENEPGHVIVNQCT